MREAEIAAIVLAMQSGMLDLMDAAIILYLLMKRNPPQRYLDLPRLNVMTLDDETCWEWFRFKKPHLDILRRALRIPDELKCKNGISETGMNGLCILLKRLSYPNRWTDGCPAFGRCPSDLCIIFYHVLDFVFANFSFLLDDISRLFWLQRDVLPVYCNAVVRKESPLTNVWGFIDGTARPMCRPSEGQQVTFSGHKRYHCLKYQSIMVPNGLIASLFGPIEGRRHDSRMLLESRIMDSIERLFDNNGTPFSIYGDPAYLIRPHLLRPFRGAVVTPIQQAF